MRSTELLERPETDLEAPETDEIRGEDAAAKRPLRDSRRFLRGYLIYVAALLLVIIAALGFLWDRMDVYERSRPERAIESWMEDNSAVDWRQTLLDQGVEPAYVNSLDLEHPEFYKRLGEYTDETPVYTVSFGGSPMLSVKLRQGEALGFGSHRWRMGDVEALNSGFTVYAPDGATVCLNGVPVGPECVAERNAQALTLGVFEENRTDIPGLTKYVLDRTYTPAGVTVTDADGADLPLSYSAGKSHYYAPMTRDCTIFVPAGAAVTVNGVPLNGQNAVSETREAAEDPYAIFKGVESFLPFECEKTYRTTWTVEGLVAQPEVRASLPDGTALEARVENGVWDFPSPPVGVPDEALKKENHDMIMDVFDAHMAYLGNRDDNLAKNYSRFSKYLVPGSEAQTQAVGAQISLVWNHDMDTYPHAELKEVLRYGQDCFTARVEFGAGSLREGQIYHNIYIFVRYGDAWRVVRIVNE